MEWISIKDRLPKDKSIVLVIRKLNGVFFIPEVVEYIEGKFDFVSPESMAEGLVCANDIITHWMYLPELPKN